MKQLLGLIRFLKFLRPWNTWEDRTMEECALLDKVRAKEGKTYADRRYEQLTEEALAFVLCTLRLMFFIQLGELLLLFLLLFK